MNAIINQVKAAGNGNFRMISEDLTYSIQIKKDGSWKTIAQGLTQGLAEQILKEGNNKLLLE